MREAPSPALSRDPLTRRALELDALAAILPMDRRDRLAEILTDDDVATLKHLAKEGMGENSLRALASDLAYLEAWVLASTGTPLPWPAPEALALKFVAQHLWDPARRETDPGHGMPDGDRRGFERRGAAAFGRPACARDRAPAAVQLGDPASLERRGRALQIAGAAVRDPAGGARHRAAADPEEPKGGDGGCAGDAARDLRLRPARRCARRGAAARRFCVGRAAAQRSRGTARRAAHRGGAGSFRSFRSQVTSKLPCLSIRLGRTKTTGADADARVFLVGRPVEALREWLARADIVKGPVFRAIDQWGGLDDKALTPQSVNAILKRRIGLAGLDPKAYSAHGLRAGYLTEAARRGVSLPEAMQQSQHRSVQQAASYYNEAERRQGRAARLI